MQQYSLSLVSPLRDWVLSVVLIAAGLVLFFGGLRFFVNRVNGATLFFLGRQSGFLHWRLLPGKVSRDETGKYNFQYNIYGSAFISSFKCCFYAILFWLVALISFSLTFVSLNAI